MAGPTLYKKKTIEQVKNRNTYPLTAEEKTRVDAVVNKFFDLFKSKYF